MKELLEFAHSRKRNAWLHPRGFLYFHVQKRSFVLKGRKRLCLVIPDLEARKPGSKAFTKWFEWFTTEAPCLHPYTLYFQTVVNKRFAQWLQRHEFTKHIEKGYTLGYYLLGTRSRPA